LKAADISIGLITNHNKFDKSEFGALRRAARKQGVFLLPGVELSIGDGHNGVHTLIAFSDAWLEGDQINTFLRTTFGGKDPSLYERENGRSDQNLVNTLRSLESYTKDFFLVFAHVEQASGLCAQRQLHRPGGRMYLTLGTVEGSGRWPIGGVGRRRAIR